MKLGLNIQIFLSENLYIEYFISFLLNLLRNSLKKLTDSGGQTDKAMFLDLL